MFFCYFWGLEFVLRLAVWRLALPPFKGERDSNRNAFRRWDGIWSCVGCECCLLVQKRNRRAGAKLLSFQFYCFHFKYSIPIIYFLS